MNVGNAEGERHREGEIQAAAWLSADTLITGYN